MVRLHIQELGYDDGFTVEPAAEQVIASLVVALKNMGRCTVQYAFTEFTVTHEVDGKRTQSDDYVRISKEKGDLDWLSGYVLIGSEARHQTDGYVVKRENFSVQGSEHPLYPTEVKPPTLHYMATCMFSIDFWKVNESELKHTMKIITKTNATGIDSWTSDNRVIEITEN